MATTPVNVKGFLHFLSDKGSEELFRDAEAVRELEQSRGWEVVKELLEAGRENAVDRITIGAVKSHEQYARDTGYISGLRAAVEAAAAVGVAADRKQHELNQKAQRAEEGGG